MRLIAVVVLVVVAMGAGARAQDIQGLEICTAERDMVRRTSCLQSNVNFLQQLIGREAAAAKRNIDAAQREIAELKRTVAELQKAVAGLQKAPRAEPDKSPR